jgi:sugar O-acyltransferase (sialic acid O-acetyltransferase NeuD family)
MKAVLIGAGGHARVVLDAARSAKDIDIIAVVDAKKELAGTRFEGLEVIGDESALPKARERGATAIVLGVGSIDVGDARRTLYERVARLGFELPAVVHRTAIVSPTATIGSADVVFAGVVVNPGAKVGTNVILNTACIVEHDVRVGDHSHISPGAHLAGGVVVGERCHIGIGATILQGVKIGDGAVVGAGAVVLRDVPATDRVAGVPARSIRAR